MKRDSLLALLAAYEPEPGLEAEMHDDTVDFVKQHPDCFERSLLKGHITASGWVLSPDKDTVLLMHHRKLDRWFQPGGHCDGDPDVRTVAMKEVMEETGIADLQALQKGIFDVDVHLIPENKDIPAHYHYDIRFAFKAAEGQEIVLNSESKDVQWIPVAQVQDANNSESIMRMVRKTSAL
ncbi:NUDIX hydrolase [Dyadobacter beijingensis]|uniref:NUDIX hydrolase n=1 Tax=Dyadobacter beijingensis TaxID=365489 RepID=A0ABQ2HHR7_9BACT|nr:NUDIX hydrolase [Dyadobacter beijingensis]GGM80437.1 NUDIX hydrolase [Dyadobacter beijingensis]